MSHPFCLHISGRSELRAPKLPSYRCEELGDGPWGGPDGSALAVLPPALRISCCSEQPALGALDKTLGIKANQRTFLFFPPYFWKCFGLASLLIKTTKKAHGQNRVGCFKEDWLFIMGCLSFKIEFCFPFLFSSVVHSCPLFISSDKKFRCQLIS